MSGRSVSISRKAPIVDDDFRGAISGVPTISEEEAQLLLASPEERKRHIEERVRKWLDQNAGASQS